jgi:SSS family solute:Na+ symporter
VSNVNFDPALEVANSIVPLDWLVFAVIIGITLGAVVLGEYRKRTTLANVDEETRLLDILLMGRRLTLPMFIATLVATWYGGIFGVTEMAFEYGIYNFVTQGVFWYAAYIIFALFIVHRVRRYQAVTLPDLVSRMFGPKSGRLSAVFNLFNVLPIAYVISVGLLLQILFGGPLWLTMSIGVVFVLMYAMWGGLRAVVFSDIVQFFVMCFAVLLVVILSVTQFGGLSFLREQLPETHFSITGGQSWGTLVVWGIVALSTLVDPNFYQRCFAADSTRTAKAGILLSTVVWFFFDICTTLGGMYAFALIPEAASGHAYLIYAVQLLPDGWRGFMLAGVAATILSTLDSYLFLAGTTVSYDLVPKRFRGRVALHHLGMIVSGIAAVVLGVAFEGNIMQVWKTLGSYMAACLLLPMMIGYFWPGRIADNQFVFASLLGAAGTTIWRFTEQTGFWANVDSLYAGALCTGIGLILFSRCKPTTVGL